MLGTRKRGIGCFLVSEHQPEPDVSLRAVLPDLRGTLLGGVLELDHGRENLVLDLDELGRVARGSERLGNDKRDAIADEAHGVADEERLEGTVALGRAEILRHQVRGEAAELFRLGIGPGQHAKHVRRDLRLRDVDPFDARMRMGGKHEHAVALARQADVVDVLTFSQQEALVLHAPHSLPDAELGHLRLPLMFKMVMPV